MFCRNCGKPMMEDDKFCSSCGVEARKPKSVWTQDPGEIGKQNEKEKEIKVEPPDEKFDWNVHTFPGATPTKTEEANFDWHVTGEEFKRRPVTEEVAFSSDKKEGPKEPEIAEELPEILSPEIPVVEEIEGPKVEIPEIKDMMAEFQQVKPERKTAEVDITLGDIRQGEPEFEKVETEPVVQEAIKQEPERIEPVELETVNQEPEKQEPEKEEPVKLEDLVEETPLESKRKPEHSRRTFFRDLFTRGENRKAEELEVPDFMPTGVVIEPKDVLDAIHKIEENKGDGNLDEEGGKQAVTGVPNIKPVVGPAIVGRPVHQDVEDEEIPVDVIKGAAGIPAVKAVVGPKLWEPASKEEPTPEPEKEISVVEYETQLEKEIFGQSEEPVNPHLARQTAKIDKFYTFNKKNEEFQELLDREYEKFKQGEETTIPGFSEKEELDTREPQPIDEIAVEPIDLSNSATQVEEMAKARELFFAEDIEQTRAVERIKEETEIGQGIESEKADLEPTETGDQSVEPVGLVEAGLEAEADEEPKEAGHEKDKQEAKLKEEPMYKAPLVDEKAKTEEEKLVEEFWEEDKEEKEGKGGKAGNVVIGVLAVILALLIILLAIRFFAPESPVAKKVDQVTHTVFYFFQGKTDSGKSNKQATGAKDRSIIEEDKTGIIQMEIDKNKGGAIGAIRYNNTLAYNGTGKFPNTDIQNATKPASNLWFTDDNGAQRYIDQGVVGATIEYAVAQGEHKKGTETLKTLDIGEIRQGDKGYYVWVAEYWLAGGHETTVDKIYLIKTDGNTMAVAEEYAI